MTCSPVYGHGHSCDGTCGLERTLQDNTANGSTDSGVSAGASDTVQTTLPKAD